MEQPTATGRSRDLHEWHRDHEDRKLAGVCAGVAAQLGASVTAVRAGFVLLTLFPAFHGVGVWLYAVLWFLMPAAPQGPSGLDRLLDVGGSLFAGRRDDYRDPPAEPRDL